MKKLTLFLTLVLTGCLVSAQSWSDKFQLGLKGGLNFSTVAGDNYESPDGRTSFYVGAQAEAPISDVLSLQPEVFYSRQGFDMAGTAGVPSTQFELDYIQVPLIFKIYLIEGLNIQAGPQFGFKVHEAVDFSPASGTNSFETDAIKDFDMQMTAGLEYKLLAALFVQARYTYGFSEVVDNLDVHNEVLSVGVGFMF